MLDFKTIKEQIHDGDRIEELLEKLGCEHVKPEQRGKLYTASLPNGSNRRSVQVKNTPTLPCAVRSRGIEAIDIFGLVSYILHGIKTAEGMQKDLINSGRWIVKQLNLNNVEGQEIRAVTKQLKWLKGIKRRRKQRFGNIEITPNKMISESVMNDFVMLPYKGWVDEGIFYETQIEFEVGFDLETRRIVTMIRDRNGDLIGVKGRTVDPNYKEKDIAKYLYIHPLNKQIELYNLHKAMPYIEKEGQILVFEGFKSCMKAWQYGYRNCVSIEGGDISPIQVQLIKEMGIDVDIVLCFDKDRTVEEIMNQSQMFRRHNLYAIYDTENLLKEKDSPVDQGFAVWEKLFLKRFKIPIDKLSKN